MMGSTVHYPNNYLDQDRPKIIRTTKIIETAKIIGTTTIISGNPRGISWHTEKSRRNLRGF